MPSSKPGKSYPEQLEILRQRGLIVPDAAFAIHCLSHHNYYRLSTYRFPLTGAGDPDRFQPGTAFTALWELMSQPAMVTPNMGFPADWRNRPIWSRFG